MQSAHDMKFGRSFANAFRGALVHFFEGEGVGTWRVGVAAESAELAVCHAYIGGIDVAVHIVVGDIAVARFADVVGQPANGEKIGSLVERNAIVKGEALARQHFVGDRLKRFYPIVSGLNWTVGENLLWSTPGIGAGAAVKLWLASPPHRRNLLDPAWREVGLGAYSTAVGTGAFAAANGPVIAVTMDFGSRGETRTTAAARH